MIAEVRDQVDWEAIKAQAKKVGENWDLVDQGGFATARFQELVMELARLCGLCAKPAGACQRRRKAVRS